MDFTPIIDKIARVRCPVLVMHGTADQVIPISNGRQLYRAVRAPKACYWVTGADHNTLIAVAGDNYGIILRRFIDQFCTGR
jgi:fermentation-respiration switch protein FrsA (DUF1100 family)